MGPLHNITHLAGMDGKQCRGEGGGGVGGEKTKEITSFKNPTCLDLFKVPLRHLPSRYVFLVLHLNLFCLVLVRRFPTRPRSIHFGDVSEMNTRETPSLFRSDHVTRNALATRERLGKNLSTAATLGTEESGHCS